MQLLLYDKITIFMMKNASNNHDVDVDLDFDDIDNDVDPHIEKKEAKTSQWNLVKNLMSKKKKFINLHDNQRESSRDQSITNGLNGINSENVMQS